MGAYITMQVCSENLLSKRAAKINFQSPYILDKEKCSEMSEDQVCEILITDKNTNEIDLQSKSTDGEDQSVYNEFIEPTDPSLTKGLDDLVSTEECMQVSYDEDLFERPLEIRDQSVYKTILGGSSK